MNEAYDGLVCVAAPIRNAGRAIAAVSVTGPARSMDWEATTDAVKCTATSIWNARFGSSGSGRRNTDSSRRHATAAR